MNDFTKKELEKLLSWGDVYGEFGHSWTYSSIKPLMDKLQSMIDNYCDHDFKTSNECHFKCSLCGERER